MPKQQTNKTAQLQPIALRDAYAAFVIARKAQNVTPRTLDYYADTLPPFIAYCEKASIRNADQVTAANVRAYLVTMQERGLAPHTVHGSARAIRALLRFCAADGLIDAAPKFQMPKLPKPVLPAFQPSDVARLLDACLAERDRVIVLFLLDTGLRASELLALNGGDIDPHTGAVLVREGKGQKQRTVYVGARTRRELVKFWRTAGHPAATGPAWCSLTTGERLGGSGLRQMLRQLGERAHVEHCHPHTFRRTFALWSLRAGMNLHTLAALMGHADIGVLRQYLALTGDDLQRAHREAGPVDRMFKR